MEIREYQSDDLQALKDHFERHWVESGANGQHFLPFDLTQPARPRGIDPTGCQKAIGAPGWQHWFVAEQHRVIWGHAGLKSDPMPAGAHRCELGMGLEAPFRRQGYGRQLLSRAVEFARAADTLQWLDLRVIGENAPAIALYERFGFTTLGKIPERFVLQGKTVDEILMTLAVR